VKWFLEAELSHWQLKQTTKKKPGVKPGALCQYNLVKQWLKS
jgi:hypothetical protein